MHAGAPPAHRPSLHFKPRVPAAAAAARAALFGPPSSAKPSTTTSLHVHTPGSHAQGSAKADQGDLQASSVLSSTLAALRQVSSGQVQAMPTSADAAQPAATSAVASVAAAAGVAELRRTEQQSNPEFKAAQEAEWEQRQVEIGKQAEHAQRLKRQRKAEKEKKARQEVCFLISIPQTLLGTGSCYEAERHRLVFPFRELMSMHDYHSRHCVGNEVVTMSRAWIQVSALQLTLFQLPANVSSRASTHMTGAL